ncbi:translation initiation factor IF-2 [Patescibacteria group bacterium]|nr:translation initiation factor IF-2 [Patescibacteria group bacterium]
MDKRNNKKRAPVVVVLGHVDHGKSSLLEAIRDFEITSKESGGITQHVGAYEVDHKDQKITFIDTPGHEAFSAIRARGAQVADIAVLVVDSADSVQPQTKEAITVINKAEIPMIVALNKIDKPTADPEKIKRELSAQNVFVESMGGKVPSVNISAKTKEGMNELLDLILLVADLEALEADVESPAEGVVIESNTDSFRGPAATLLVQKGTLKIKDVIGTDTACAKIKGLEDFQGRAIKKAIPSQPTIVLGFDKAPWVGEKFQTFDSLDQAAGNMKEVKRADLSFSLKEGQKVLNIILKADVVGSLEALVEILKELPQEKVALRILKSEIGDIVESDTKVAETSKAQIVGFRVKVNPGVLQAMRKDKEKRVKIKTFDVIYNLVQEVRQMMEKNIAPEVVRQDIGKMKTLVVFWAEGRRQIVGGKVFEGEFKKGLKLEVQRNSEKVGEGKIINLQRNKKDVDRAIKGDECGILFEGSVKIEEGDIIVAFSEERVRDTL